MEAALLSSQCAQIRRVLEQTKMRSFTRRNPNMMAKKSLMLSALTLALGFGSSAVLADAGNTGPTGGGEQVASDAESGSAAASQGSLAVAIDDIDASNNSDNSTDNSTNTDLALDVSDSGNDNSDNSTNTDLDLEIADSGNDNSDNSTNTDIRDSGNDNSDNSTRTDVKVSDSGNDNSDNSTRTDVKVSDSGNDNSDNSTNTDIRDSGNDNSDSSIRVSDSGNTRDSGNIKVEDAFNTSTYVVATTSSMAATVTDNSLTLAEGSTYGSGNTIAGSAFGETAGITQVAMSS